MATSGQVLFAGTELQRGDGATPTEVFTKIAQLTDIDAIDGEAADIQVTSADSVAHEYCPGLADNGNFSATFNLVPTDAMQQQLYADRDARTTHNFKLVLPDGTEFAFAASVRRFQVNASVDDKYTAAITLRVSGAVTPTWAT